MPTLNPSNIKEMGGLEAVVSKQHAGQILMTHLYHSSENVSIINKYGSKCIFILRDPRDIIVSTIFYVTRNSKHHLYNVMSKRATFKEKMHLLIQGSDNDRIPPYDQYLNYFSGWLGEECLVVRFEELVDNFGKPDLPSQTVKKIYHYLGTKIGHEQIEKIHSNMISTRNPTYRRGTTQQWKEYFDTETKHIFKNIAGDMLIRFGYEDDYNW